MGKREYREGAHTVYDLKWARGYFCASSGTVTDEMIKAYIAQQDVPPDDVSR